MLLDSGGGVSVRMVVISEDDCATVVCIRAEEDSATVVCEEDSSTVVV